MAVGCSVSICTQATLALAVAGAHTTAHAVTLPWQTKNQPLVIIACFACAVYTVAPPMPSKQGLAASPCSKQGLIWMLWNAAPQTLRRYPRSSNLLKGYCTKVFALICMKQQRCKPRFASPESALASKNHIGSLGIRFMPPPLVTRKGHARGKIPKQTARDADHGSASLALFG